MTRQEDRHFKRRQKAWIKNAAAGAETRLKTDGFHKHPNGGGLVADTADVEDTAYDEVIRHKKEL